MIFVHQGQPPAQQGPAPQQLDPKKLPPGHAIFTHFDTKPIVLYRGEFYNLAGQRLKKEAKWLRDNGYTLTREMYGYLKTQEVAPQTKNCTSCGTGGIPYSHKFCSNCGAEQVLDLTPGESDIMQTLSMIDPKDPFAMLTPATQLPPRVRPEDLMPTADDIASDARRDANFPREAVGVPGEGAHSTAPKGAVAVGSQVGFQGQRMVGGPPPRL